MEESSESDVRKNREDKCITPSPQKHTDSTVIQTDRHRHAVLLPLQTTPPIIKRTYSTFHNLKFVQMFRSTVSRWKWVFEILSITV